MNKLEIYNRLSSLEKNRFFIVSNVVDEANSEGLEEFDVSFIKVNVNEGIRCDRCWNRYEEKEVNEEKSVIAVWRLLKNMKKQLNKDTLIEFFKTYWFFLITVLLVVVDQVTKVLFQSYLKVYLIKVLKLYLTYLVGV